MITLSTSGNSVIFTFQDNQHYLQNGTIEVPKNSLMLVTDESNMATFKKSASNDIFISALYSELGMSKSELEAWFEENATTNYGGGGGGGDVTSAQVQTMIDESISGKQDTLIEGVGIQISGDVITATYDGYQYIEQMRSSFNNITEDFYMIGGVDCSGEEYGYVMLDDQNGSYWNFKLEMDTHQWSLDSYQGEEDGWTAYMDIEWDDSVKLFKATVKQEIPYIGDATCGRVIDPSWVSIEGSGTTNDAFNSAFDKIKETKDYVDEVSGDLSSTINGITPNYLDICGVREFGDSLRVSLAANNYTLESKARILPEGGIALTDVDGQGYQLTTLTPISNPRWYSASTDVDGSNSEYFKSPSSAMTFDMSRNPRSELWAQISYSAGINLIDRFGRNMNPDHFDIVNDNGHITVTSKDNTRFVALYDVSGEMPQYITNLQYWGYESNTIPNAVLRLFNETVASAEYVSSSTTINFKNVDGTVISSIDASDFIIDGMVEDVRIDTISGVSYLVIDFNTASGKQDIQIPLTDIFDPSNYYDKTAIDNIVSGINDDISAKLDTSAFTVYSGSVETALSGKQDTLTAGSGITISGNVISATGGITSGEVQTMIDESISGKADTSAVTASINAAISGKVDTSAFTAYTSATDARLSEDEEVTAAALNDLNEAVSGIDSTLQDIEGALLDRVTTSDFQSFSGSVESELDDKVDNSTYSAYTAVTDAALSEKADTSAVTADIEAAVSGKQDTLIAGDNITISGNVISADGGVSESAFTAYTASTDSRLAEDEEVTAAALNALNDNFGGLKLVKLTQQEYDALVTKDSSTLYIIA